MPPSNFSWIAGTGRRNKSPWVLVLVASLLASAFIYFLDIAPGNDSHVELVDRADFGIPVCHIAAQAEFHNWFPFAAGGADTALLCSDRSSLSVQQQLFCRLPMRLAYPVFCIVHGLMLSVGTCLLASRFGRNVPTLAIVAIALTTQCVSTHLRGPFPCFGLAESLTPLVAWVIYVLADRPGIVSRAAALMAGVVAGMNISPVVLPFMIFGVAACFVIAPPRSISALATTGGLFLAGCLAAVWSELMILVAYAPESHRSLWNMYHPQIHGVFREWNRVSSFVASHWVLVAAALAGASLRGVRRPAIIRSVGILIIIVAGLSVWPFIWQVFRDYLGPFASLQPSRFPRFVAIPALAIGATLSLQTLFESRGPVWRGLLSGPNLGSLLVVALILSVAWGGWVRIRHKSDELQKGYTYARLFHNSRIADVARLAAAEQVRVAVIRGEFLRPGMMWAYGIETAGGKGLHSMRYHRYWGHMIAGELAIRDRERILFWNWGNRLTFRPVPPGTLFEDIYDMDLMALANVGYVISERPLPGNVLSLVSEGKGEGKGEDPFVYQLPGVLPRAFLVSTDRVDWAERSFAGDESLHWKDKLEQTRQEIARQEHGTVQGPGQQAAGRLTFEVRASTPCTLVVLNRYSTFCRATVDDRPATVRPAFGAFVGVEVPPGAHSIELIMTRSD